MNLIFDLLLSETEIVHVCICLHDLLFRSLLTNTFTCFIMIRNFFLRKLKLQVLASFNETLFPLKERSVYFQNPLQVHTQEAFIILQF